MKKLFFLFYFMSVSVFAQKQIGGNCEDCELIFAGISQVLAWQTSIGEKNEPGEKLEISGIIYKKDGKTPASDIILYIYHTNAKGKYEPAPKQINARKHGHLRAWIKTDTNGKYKFNTIRPAAYPNLKFPSHIHPIIKEPNKNEYWIDEYHFDDDPLLTPKEKANFQNRGGSGVIKLHKNNKGVWVGKRDIILGKNIPNYE